MVRYSLIVDYLDRGNNFSQVARLCCCSRMTVWRVVQRLDSIKIETIDLKHISEGELRSLLFPERVKKGEKSNSFCRSLIILEISFKFTSQLKSASLRYVFIFLQKI